MYELYVVSVWRTAIIEPTASITHWIWIKWPPFFRRHLQIHDKFVKILPTFVIKFSIDNKLVLVQAMARRRTGNEPLPEKMLTKSCGTIWRTRSQWVNYWTHHEQPSRSNAPVQPNFSKANHLHPCFTRFVQYILPLFSWKYRCSNQYFDMENITVQFYV